MVGGDAFNAHKFDISNLNKRYAADVCEIVTIGLEYLSFTFVICELHINETVPFLIYKFWAGC